MVRRDGDAIVAPVSFRDASAPRVLRRGPCAVVGNPRSGVPRVVLVRHEHARRVEALRELAKARALGEQEVSSARHPWNGRGARTKRWGGPPAAS